MAYAPLTYSRRNADESGTFTSNPSGASMNRPMLLRCVQNRGYSGDLAVEESTHIEYMYQFIDRATAMLWQEAPRRHIGSGILL